MTFASVLKTGFTMTAVVVGLAGCTAMQPSNVVSLTAKLSGANEVPAVTTSGTGMAEATLNKDTNVLKWTVTYSGLTGPALAGHFHGPAAAGSNAGVAVPFSSAASPIEGQATLTPAQVSDLMAGKWYANIHTAANKGGEIRGQLMPGM
ncbi:CHRD domain-containing protein [Hydrogenophaga sp. PAMC20947]|nr:CHRD domain-containing protein [Hydrogenophaga sp. PAMC20947]